MKLLCNQCSKLRPDKEFLPHRPGQKTQNCAGCRERARKHLKVLNHRTGLPTESPLCTTIVAESCNRKLGPIPEVWVTASTCPASCMYYNRGCYGESGIMRKHWRDVERNGVPWKELLKFVAALPDGQLWRYAVVGDLPGIGDDVDEPALLSLVEANRGRRGFTFTHKRAFGLIDTANRSGFTINVSCDTLSQCDEMYGVAPLAVVLALDAPVRQVTPQGSPVIKCPATYKDGVKCASCGICAQPYRRSIIGFPAHGLRKREVSDLASQPNPLGH